LMTAHHTCGMFYTYTTLFRSGRNPIAVPEGVTVDTNARVVTVKGPKGTLTFEHRPEVGVVVDDGSITVENRRSGRDREARAHHEIGRAACRERGEGPGTGAQR